MASRPSAWRSVRRGSLTGYPPAAGGVPAAACWAARGIGILRRVRPGLILLAKSADRFAPVRDLPLAEEGRVPLAPRLLPSAESASIVALPREVVRASSNFLTSSPRSLAYCT